MKIDRTTAVAVMVLAMSAIPALSQTYNYFYPGGALFGSATVQSVNLASGSYIAGNLPVTNLNSGIGANSSTVWCGNATWCTPPGGGGSFANPSAVIGLTANNGTATTGIRSDASSALSQAILPTWTAKHTFNGTVLMNPVTSLQTLIVNGSVNQATMSVVGGATTGQSVGEVIKAGTTSADFAFYVANQSNATTFLKIFGDGGITTGTLTDEGAGSINASSLWIGNTKLGASVTTTFTAGQIAGFASSCTILGAGSPTYYNANIASCTGGTGGYTVVFTTPYTKYPTCTATADSTSILIATTSNATQVSFNLANSTTPGTGVSGGFSFTCFGN